MIYFRAQARVAWVQPEVPRYEVWAEGGAYQIMLGGGDGEEGLGRAWGREWEGDKEKENRERGKMGRKD